MSIGALKIAGSLRVNVGQFDPHPRITIYYGGGKFFLVAGRLLQGGPGVRARRPSASILLARNGPFTLDAGDRSAFSTRAVLLAPNVERRQLAAVDGGIALFDLPFHATEFAALAPLLQDRQIRELDADAFAHLQGAIDQGFEGGLECSHVNQLIGDVVRVAAGRSRAGDERDERVAAAMRMMQELPFAQSALPTIARELSISASRLRHLFIEEIDTTFSQYRRYVTVWKAIALVKQKRSFTEIAHAAGFCDLAHLGHAFFELFGFSLSVAIDPQHVVTCRCESVWGQANLTVPPNARKSLSAQSR